MTLNYCLWGALKKWLSISIIKGCSIVSEWNAKPVSCLERVNKQMQEQRTRSLLALQFAFSPHSVTAFVQPCRLAWIRMLHWLLTKGRSLPIAKHDTQPLPSSTLLPHLCPQRSCDSNNYARRSVSVCGTATHLIPFKRSHEGVVSVLLTCLCF